MFTETLTEHDDVIGIVCEGKLSKDDLSEMHVLLDERLATGQKLGLVVDLAEFDGYESLAALRDDVKMDTAHRNDFSRIAVIGDDVWMEWGSKLASSLTRSEMRWFDSHDREDAIVWVRRK